LWQISNFQIVAKKNKNAESEKAAEAAISTAQDLSEYWVQAPDAKVLYQVGEYYFLAPQYAESYARLVDAEIVTHEKPQSDEKGEGAEN
jgi:hypothetical protein